MKLNKVEVLKIAIQIEERGVEYYKKAAEYLKNPDAKKLCMSLASMEEQHHKLFSRMEKKEKPSGYEESEIIQAYLNENFDPGLFSENEAGKIGKELETSEQIFQIALKKEQQSVDFYSKILEGLIEKNDVDTLQLIISEEKSHIELISSYMNR